MSAGTAMIETSRTMLHEPAATTPATLEEFAYRFGRSYDSYLANESDRQAFWSSDGSGVVGYVRAGRYLNVGGGLLAPEEQKQTLLAELVAYADRSPLLLSFYNVADDELPLFREYGFQVTKWGEEAIVDLADCTWEGKAYEWVRRQSNYCRRKGLLTAECRREAMSEAAWFRLVAELNEISAASLAGKPQCREMRFLDGRFDPLRLQRRRLFVARADEGMGRIEAFLVANPFREGAMWAFDLYRHRPDAVRGAVASLMHQAMRKLQAEGVEGVSLCLVPGLGTGRPQAGDSALARRGVTLGSRYFNFILDTAGQYHFKSRFRPHFESRYICARPKVTFGSAWSLIRVLGVLDLDANKLLRLLGKRCRSRASRATLSMHRERA